MKAQRGVPVRDAYLRDEARKRGWGITKLAERAGVSYGTAWNAWHGKPVDWATLCKLDAAITSSVDEIVPLSLLAAEAQ